MESYDNSGQDTSNFGDADGSYASYDTRQDNYESPQHHESNHNNYSPQHHGSTHDNYSPQHHGLTHDNYSFAKENDSPKSPEAKSVEFNLPPSTDETSNLIDIQKDHVSSESQESTPPLGNYENSIIDHFDSAFVNLQKDIEPINESQNVSKNENGMNNQNDNPDKDDYGCCSCNGGPLVCLAFFCDCFGL